MLTMTSADITQLDTMMRSKQRWKHEHRKVPLTTDDTKVLGRITTMRTEKVYESRKFGTNKMKTHNSAWTPIVNKASNEQIFVERRDLVSHWFDLWTDSQRKRFFDLVFRQCSPKQYKFVQDWFEQWVPLQHLDFTTVLPRFLSLYVMSFLEPKSLSRCAQVCWHWKYLAEQDVLWIPKCSKYGWYLPFTPSDNETGAWKKHYVACVNTMDYVSSSDPMYGTLGDGRDLMHKKSLKKGLQLSLVESNKMLTSRPPWQGPDSHPKDLDRNMYAFIHDYNPNEPHMPKSALLFHNRWGILKKKSNLTTDLGMELGLNTQRRRGQHRALVTEDDFDLIQTGHSMTLSETLEDSGVYNPTEKRLTNLGNTAYNLAPRIGTRMPNLSGGQAIYPGLVKGHTTVKGKERLQNPRVIFISSRVPASEMLLDAVLFGVIPIVYEYEGTTTESLCRRLETVLQGTHAQSIGLFCHSEEPGEIKLVHGCNVKLKTLDHPDVREFFETLSGHVLPSDKGGQLDMFTPLAASEAGMELIVQLTILTGVQFSSPTGIIGNYNHVNTEWCIPYEEGSPTCVYFNNSKLNVWSNTADQATEALKKCHKVLAPFFERTHKDITAQLTGEMLFRVLGQTNVRGVKDITTAIVEGLCQLSYQEDVNPLEFLGQFLLRKAGVSNFQFTGTRKSSVKVDQDADKDESEAQGKDAEDQEDQTRDWDEENYEEAGKDEGTEKGMMMKQKDIVLQRTLQMSHKFGTLRMTGKFEKLTVQRYNDHPEKRTPIAMEVASSEVEYNRLLHAVKNVYFKPLNAALKSNRAIISNQNLQVIFTDVLAIMELSNNLKESLQNRMLEWDAQHSCLGDIFVQFSTHLKVYTNFVNNNEVILRCIDRSKEQTPTFRAFLKRNDRTPQTKMLTLQELLLLPTKRINEYVKLLSWFELHTAKSHPDRGDLSSALDTLIELDRCIQECKLRMERDRELVELQRSIQNCPALLEANRYLIKQQDVFQFNPPKKSSEIPELQVFQHAAMYGLFLFNDALMMARRTSKHFPFSRGVENIYKFEDSVSLSKLRIHDMSDSKDMKNAFSLETPRQQWYFSTDKMEEKLNLISLLEQSVRTVLEA